MLNYQLITTDAALQQICEQARTHTHIALDTEFVRTRTYFPQLGLIQLYDGKHLTLIDPLSIQEWQPFQALLQDRKVVKLLHAGGEDLELLLNMFNQLPAPLLDTQVLAAFTGKTLSCGYAKLVAEYINVELDKSESRTDWLMRPLSEKQCGYAAADVLYLLPLASQLIEATRAAGYLEAATEECLLLCRRRSKPQDPKLAYRKIVNVWQLSPRQLACLQKLASWRLRKAREQDLAVNFVVKEELLWQIARYQPTSLDELASLGLNGREIRRYGDTLLALVKESKGVAESDFPIPVANLVDQADYKNVFKEIKVLIQSISKSSGLSSELLASRRQINQLLNWHWQLKSVASRPELLIGWRGDLLAGSLQAMLEHY